MYHKEFHERISENAVYRLQISALVPEIFKFEKWVKYANEMADDVIHSTQYFIEYINRVILANLQRKTFKLGRLIDLQETHLWHGNFLFSRPHPLENVRQRHKVELTYL